MAKITWTVEHEWEYDEKRIVTETKKLLANYPNYTEKDLDDALIDIIDEEIMGEDDDVYYSFPSECLIRIKDDIKKKYFVKQLTLF